MGQKMRRRLVAGSALLALGGAMVTVLYILQPWRSCDYEDTAMGCAMLPPDAIVMATAMLVTLTAIVVFVIALLVKEAPASR